MEGRAFPGPQVRGTSGRPDLWLGGEGEGLVEGVVGYWATPAAMANPAVWSAGGVPAGWRSGKAGVFGVDGVGIIGPQSQLHEGAGVRHQLGLPALVGLKLLHGGHGGCVPIPGRFAGKIVLANQGLLNLRNPLRLECPAGRAPWRVLVLGLVRTCANCRRGARSGRTVNVRGKNRAPRSSSRKTELPDLLDMKTRVYLPQ